MVISHQQRYAYSVIPKTASTSLRNALSIWTDYGPPVTKTAQHVPLHKIVKTKWEEYFDIYNSFSFVRNPYDRIYSGFKQDIYASKILKQWADVKIPIFESIDYNFSHYLQEFVANADIYDNWEWICFCPMHLFTKYKHIEVSFIGRFESFEHDILALSKFLNLDIKIESYNNRREGTGIELEYLKYYSDSDIELVNKLYEEDFKEFGYQMIDSK